MIQMLFSLKYQSQIRRTRADLFSYLEKTIINSMVSSGGKIRQEYHCIIAQFDEQTIGFWSDILTVIEKILTVTTEAENDLYGHTCILSSNIADEMIPVILLALPSSRNISGIWCDSNIHGFLKPFVFFNNPQSAKWNIQLGKTFLELKSIKKIEDTQRQYPLRKEIEKKLKEDFPKNTVLVGRDYIGKRDSLHWYCANMRNDFIPLTIRFGSWTSSVGCFADAFCPAIRDNILKNGIKIPEELNGLFEILFRERLRSECTNYLIKKCKVFFKLFLDLYIKAAENQKCFPVIILENIQNADSNMREIFFEVYKEYRKQAVVYGTYSFSELPSVWEKIFDKAIFCSSQNVPIFSNINLSESLWEIAFVCKLFCQYYPAWSLFYLFEEEGRNTGAIRNSLYMLFKNGIIRSLDDPEPEVLGFYEGVEKLLGSRADYIKKMVKNRLLSWVANGRLTPCFNLLEILFEMGEEPSPLLVLESVKQDTLIGAFRDIDKSIADGRFDDICGKENSAAISYIYKTKKSLIYGNEKDIKETFRIQPPSNITLNAYKAQFLTINAAYKIGINDVNTALEEIKEAMIICQNTSNRIGIAQVYRLFALVHYHNKNINDAIDYLNFALEETERIKDFNEMAIVSFYSATTHFIFGNISKAIRLINQAIHAAENSGAQEWALKSHFLLGRFYFEIGLYEDAVKIFIKLRSDCKDNPPSQKAMMLDAWIFRAKLYLYPQVPDKPEYLNWDGKLFEIESAYLSGDYKKIIELSDVFINLPSDEGCYFLEQPDWSSGFAQCELLLYSKKEYWLRMISVWRSLAVCGIEKNNSNDAVHTMQQIVRDERMTDIDPCAAFYFFSNFRVLNESEAMEVDRNTAISIAFKRLQSRASKIDDVDIRRQFLTQQYWNKLLFATAKEYKLI